MKLLFCRLQNAFRWWRSRFRPWGWCSLWLIRLRLMVRIVWRFKMVCWPLLILGVSSLFFVFTSIIDANKGQLKGFSMLTVGSWYWQDPEAYKSKMWKDKNVGNTSFNYWISQTDLLTLPQVNTWNHWLNNALRFFAAISEESAFVSMIILSGLT